MEITEFRKTPTCIHTPSAFTRMKLNDVSLHCAMPIQQFMAHIVANQLCFWDTSHHESKQLAFSFLADRFGLIWNRSFFYHWVRLCIWYKIHPTERSIAADRVSWTVNYTMLQTIWINLLSMWNWSKPNISWPEQW